MTAGYEQRPEGIERAGLYEQNALQYLDTADAAVALAESHVDLQWAGTTHPEFFEGSGLTDGQLNAATKLGGDILANAATAKTRGMDGRAPNILRSTKDLREAADAYQGIESVPNI